MRRAAAAMCLLLGLGLVVYNGLDYYYPTRWVLMYSENARLGLAAGVILLAASGLLFRR